MTFFINAFKGINCMRFINADTRKNYSISIDLVFCKNKVIFFSLLFFLFTTYAAAEQGDIPPLEASVAVQLSPRVSDGLLVLYTFEEGSGDVVTDLGGVGDPLNLTIAPLSATNWTTGGLSVNSNTLIASAGAATKVNAAIQASQSLTIEAWVTPANTTQSGPARIVSLSHDYLARNFTLGQQDTEYDFRLRSSDTSNNGKPSIATNNGSVTTALTHVLYTRDASGVAAMYVDGVAQASGTISGDLSNWNSGYRLALANELTSNRHWRGELHLVAIYDRALTAGDVNQNYTAGPDGTNGDNQLPIANAGIDQNVNENELVNLNGSASSDTDGTITSHNWIQTQGPVVTLNNANTATPNFTAPSISTATIFTFELTVIDNDGSSAVDQITITVGNGNQLPTANAGTDQSVNENVFVNLNGSASSDTDGTISSHNWTQTQGPVVTLNNANTATPNFTAPSVSTATIFTFELTVTDNDGGSAVDQITVTVGNVQLSPRVSDGLLVLYTFEEGSGDVVTDLGGVGDPLNLTIAPLSATNWTTGGLSVNSNTLIASAGAATKVNAAIQASQSLTIEAWVTPANTTQSGPARIVSLSHDYLARNFTLGQQDTEYDFRLRSSDTSNNGKPSIATNNGSVTTALTHVLYTRDASGVAAMYVDGVAQASGTISGDLSNWNSGYRLALANELTSNRHWRGELHLVAIYDRALTAGDVNQNYTAGPDGTNGDNQLPIANAGIDQNVNENELVNLNGSASSDTDGTITSHNWIQTQGPVVTLNNANTATPNFTAPSVSTVTNLVFELTVTDNDGGSAVDQIFVRIGSINSLPVITLTYISPTNILSDGHQAWLWATAYDAEDGDLTALINWQEELSTATGTGDHFAFTPIVGVHSVLANVIDSSGGEASVVITFNVVSSLGTPEIISLSPSSGSIAGGEEVTIIGNNFTPATWVQFDFKDAQNVQFIDSNTLIATTPPSVTGIIDVDVLEGFEQYSGTWLSQSYTYQNVSIDSYIDLNACSSSLPAINPGLVICEPIDQSNLNTNSVTVIGNYQGDKNINIRVNGIDSCIHNNLFIANNVPLQNGTSNITAEFYTIDGLIASDTEVVTNALNEDQLISANEYCGTAPFNVSFNYTEGLYNNVRIDFDNDGVFDYDSVYDGAANYTYENSGIYLVTAEFSSDFSIEKRTIYISVAEESDEVFKQVWNGMRNALEVGDKLSAMKHVSANGALVLDGVFDSLMENMPDIFAELSGIEKISISDQVADFGVIRIEDGLIKTYVINYIKDSNGLWKIDSL